MLLLYVYIHVSAGAGRGQKRAIDPQDLELQEVGVLETKLVFCKIGVFHHEPILFLCFPRSLSFFQGITVLLGFELLGSIQSLSSAPFLPSGSWNSSTKHPTQPASLPLLSTFPMLGSGDSALRQLQDPGSQGVSPALGRNIA